VLDYAFVVKRKLEKATRAMTNSPGKKFSAFLKVHFDGTKALDRFLTDEANLAAALEKALNDQATSGSGSGSDTEDAADVSAGEMTAATLVVSSAEPTPKEIGGALATRSLVSEVESGSTTQEAINEDYVKVMDKQMAKIPSIPTTPFHVAVADRRPLIEFGGPGGPRMSGQGPVKPTFDVDDADDDVELEEQEMKKVALEERGKLNEDDIKGFAWLPLANGAKLFANSIREVRIAPRCAAARGGICASFWVPASNLFFPFFLCAVFKCVSTRVTYPPAPELAATTHMHSVVRARPHALMTS
jgi:hypothetical protein